LSEEAHLECVGPENEIQEMNGDIMIKSQAQNCIGAHPIWVGIVRLAAKKRHEREWASLLHKINGVGI